MVFVHILVYDHICTLCLPSLKDIYRPETRGVRYRTAKCNTAYALI